MSDYDCIVLGVGGMGSAASYYAARRGWKVLGLDRFPAGHARGSSHGRTRIIRQAYYEHPNYVPLAVEAYGLWHEIEATCGTPLYQRTGLLQVGDPGGDVIGGVQRSAAAHHLSVETLTAEEIVQRWPMFNLPQHHIGLFEQIAGSLAVEKCVTTLVDLARTAGADFRFDTNVLDWRVRRGIVQVITDQGTLSAPRLIMSPGAWAGQRLPQLSGQLRIVRKHQHWFAIDDDRFDLASGCPTFLFESDRGYFYGFPRNTEGWVKLAEHTGGEAVDDPLTVDRDIDPVDLERVTQFSHQYFNSPRGVHVDHSVCMYTMTPDEHFVVDVIDDHPQIAFACGFSGHGFKFAPLIGKYLVELVDGQRRSEMEYLSSRRFGLRTV